MIKNTLLLTSTLIFFSLESGAITITTVTASFLEDSNNTRIPDNTGVVAIGSFGALEPTFGSSFTASDITSGFQQLGQNSFTSPQALDGFFNFEIDANIDSNFAGLPVYLIAGNGSDLSSSTDFLVWRATSNVEGNVFIEDNPVGGPSTIQLNNDNGDLLLGSFSAAVNTFTLAAAAVPEPSSSALLALAGVGFVLRRRR